MWLPSIYSFIHSSPVECVPAAVFLSAGRDCFEESLSFLAFVRSVLSLGGGIPKFLTMGFEDRDPDVSFSLILAMGTTYTDDELKGFMPFFCRLIVWELP